MTVSKKGFKVTDAKRSRIVGVACSSLEELKKKGCDKLGIPQKGTILQLQDGTFVDDEEYFSTLTSQTLFILLQPGENAVTGAQLILHALETVNVDYLRAGKEAFKFLTTDLKDKVRRLAKLVTDKSENVKLSSQFEDPEWFECLHTSSNTKEEFMFRRAQDRIRGYLYKTQDDLKKSDMFRTHQQVRQKLTATMLEMSAQLRTSKYFGGYFDRSDDMHRLCNSFGSFHCSDSHSVKCIVLAVPGVIQDAKMKVLQQKGRWDAADCRYDGAAAGIGHHINPYASREARIVFSTWNLDHIIERSRSIVPAVLEAADEATKKGCLINSKYFFQLLFTTNNLKLVHIVCHDKGAHTAKCDPNNYLISTNEAQCSQQMCNEAPVVALSCYV